VGPGRQARGAPVASLAATVNPVDLTQRVLHIRRIMGQMEQVLKEADEEGALAHARLSEADRMAVEAQLHESRTVLELLHGMLSQAEHPAAGDEGS